MEYKLKPIKKDNMRIARKSDVWHNLERGILFDSYYDLETSDLSKEFAQPTEFGGLITDLAGNIMYVADIRARVNDYTLFNPYAWIVTRMNREKLNSGISQYQLAGQIMNFFHISNHLDEAPFQNRFLRLCKSGVHKSSEKGQERYYSYPLLNDDGSVDYDSVRIHHSGKKFYLKDQKTGLWHTKRIASMSIGYNNVSADDQWIWTCLHMAGAENIFHTHVKRLGKYRLDALRRHEAVTTLGKKSEKGVQAGKTAHSETLEEIKTFTQGSAFDANTRIGSILRSISEGITNPDGSYINLDNLHGAFKDAFGLCGLSHFTRKQEPEICREMDMNTDWYHVAERLTEKLNGFGDHPVMAMVDKEYPYVTGKMVTLIGTDQYRHQPKWALVYDLANDPRTFHFNGKPLKELEPKDYAKLIEQGILKVVKTHQSPRLFDAEKGYRAGFNNGVERDDMVLRAHFLNDQVFIKKAMKGLVLAHPKLAGPQSILYPQPEQERFIFSTLEKRDLDLNQQIQILPEPDTLDMRVQHARKYMIDIKKLLLSAIEPYDDILVNSYDNGSSEEQVAVKKFLDKIKDINKKLANKKAPKLPDPARPVTDKPTALRYKMQLLHAVRNMFARGEAHDLGHNFWVEDRYGHRLDMEELHKWDQKQIDFARANGDFNIVYEETNVTQEIIDRNLDEAGLSDMLGPEVQQHLQDVKTLRRWGIPSLNGDDVWYTIPQARRDVKRLLNNELSGSDMKALENRYPGLWDKFMHSHHDVQSSFAEYIAYLDEQEARFPSLTREQLIRLKIDPDTGVPIEKTRYEIDPARVVTLTVPERYVEEPSIDPISRKSVWIVNLTNEFNREALGKALAKGNDIVLRTNGTGKIFHLPKAIIKDPVPSRSGVYEDFYKGVNKVYIGSSMLLSKLNKTVALIGEMLSPVHANDNHLSEHQTLRLDKNLFEGVADHKIAGYAHKISGIILYDDGLSINQGPVRLLEKDKNGHDTGWEMGGDITKVCRLSINQIARFGDEKASSYGFANTRDMVDHFSREFSTYKLDPKDKESKVWVIDFTAHDPFDAERGTKYFNPADRKISAFKRNFEIIESDEDGEYDDSFTR